jgi:hypothetical protein
MINLSNYEEYFLLYIDNELSKEECQAVEAFVHQYPHLAAELDMLQGAKLPPADAVVFSNKTTLYKVAENSINIDNYEEYFLLHTDKELTATQEEEVEQFVLQHPQLQEEFLLMQRAKLVPENIEYPDKDRLYKKPAKRVIPLYLARMSVAASVAGIIVLVGSYLMNNNSNHPQVAANTPQNKPIEKIATPEKQMGVVLPGKEQDEVVIAKNETKRAAQAPVKVAKVGNEKPVPDNIRGSNKEPVIVRIDPLPAAQQTIPAPEDNTASNNVAPQYGHVAGLKPLVETDENEPASTVMYVSNDYTPAKPAVYKELNTDEDDQTLYIGALQLNKAKVNGLVKKVTHLLGTKSRESNL